MLPVCSECVAIASAQYRLSARLGVDRVGAIQTLCVVAVHVVLLRLCVRKLDQIAVMRELCWRKCGQGVLRPRCYASTELSIV